MKLFQISDLRHITCSVPGAGGQPYGGKRLLWESGMGGVGISGSCCLTFEFCFNFSFSPRSGMYLTWGRLVFHRSRHKISRWWSRKQVYCDVRNYFYVQPVLDFLLWHHLGPNYEERAHDLLQVNFPKTQFNRLLIQLHVTCDMWYVGVQAIFLQLRQWDEPCPPGWTVHMEDRDTTHKVSYFSPQKLP